MEAREQVEKFREFIDKNYISKLADNLRKDMKFLVIDFGELSKFNPELADLLLEQPEDSIKAAEIAISQFDFENVAGTKARFMNLPESAYMPIRNIRSKHLDKIFQIGGVIRQKSDVRPQATAAKFSCPSCGNVINVLQLDQSFQEPNRCGCGRKGKFTLISKELVDVQGLMLEEDPEKIEGNEQPKRINIFLKDDLVSPISEKKTFPGSKLNVIGIIKEVPVILRTGSKSTRFDLLVEANYIESVDETFLEVEITPEEEKQILELAADPLVLPRLVDSLAPSIYGYEKVKEAILLQMIGGVHKVREDGVISRGDMHILLIGDPGSGKSALLKRANLIAPKARYVSGKGVSAAGLTASVVKDEFLRGWSLEAGAMVLASNGLCCIDEMNQISVDDLSALHEAMENQTISISKATIQATLPARTTVLAAANPKFGRFDPYGVIAEQINLPPSLINRFDLIFTIKDLPDKFKDDALATHMLNLHQKPKMKKAEFGTKFLKKYIGYIKKKINPELSEEAIKEIKDYYLKMRDNSTNNDGILTIQISPRQLEALVRLSEANARVRISQEVTKKDAQNAIDLVRYCMLDVGVDKETGKFDIDKIATGVSSSTRSNIIIVKSIIRRLKEKFNNLIPIEDIVKDAKSQGVEEDKVDEVIEKMKNVGDIMEPRYGFVQIIEHQNLGGW